MIVDVLFGALFCRMLGFDVLCGDRVHRYLPLPACKLHDEAVAVPSALVLMARELDFYRARCRSLAVLRGFPARKGKAELGVVADIVFAPTGELLDVVVEREGRESRVPIDRSLVLGPDALRSAV